ncbi:hypothetical protein R5R35_004418 [Gryllus longicercus]|uniref:Uncharacterized protein n=1 Tax=Gryllus longicercus TaxID=2509291 RepID=A0AAN9VK87_9ORTH
METRTRKKALKNMPLPKERRGTSGAIAGGDSMRADGDQQLCRRALVGIPEMRQPERSEPTSNVSPAEGVAQVLQPVPTQARLPTQRRKWPTAVNEQIMRIYYRITKIDTDVTGYRQKLYREFQQSFPEYSLTEQRVSDQYRVILRNKLIPETWLQAMQMEVRRELELNEVVDTQLRESEINPDTHINVPTAGDTTTTEVERLVESLKMGMSEAMLQFEGTDPTMSPALPEANTSRRMARIIDIMNCEVLPEEIKMAQNLQSLHLSIYCTAVVVVKSLEINCDKLTRKKQTGRMMPPWETSRQEHRNTER